MHSIRRVWEGSNLSKDSGPSRLQHMKPGTVIQALMPWSMDIPDGKRIIFDVRECGVGERFVVVSEPFLMNGNYMGFFVHGTHGLEMVNEYVHNRKAFGQISEAYFEEIK